MTIQSEIENKAINLTCKDTLHSSNLKGPPSYPNIKPLDFIRNKVQEGMDDSFLVADLGEIYNSLKLWKQHLPNVIPFYAVKSNPDRTMLRLMGQLGMSFDCASKKEIDTILTFGVNPDSIIYANPCKHPSHLRFARDKGVLKTTFDNIDELHKIKQIHPNAELFLRILPLDQHSKVPFGEKFGAGVGDASYELLLEAWKLGLKVCGISFHVGSDCLEPAAYSETILRARAVFDQAKELGHPITTLDIGGGFPGAHKKIEFAKIAQAIQITLDTHFGDEDLKIIAEPGRFFAAPVMMLAASVIGKRKCIGNNNQDTIMYYLSDGVFKSFSEGAFIPEILYEPHLLSPKQSVHSKKNIECSLWGPALGAKDKINIRKGLKLPELNLDDWVYFENMGSYSICFNMEFNGFEQSRIFYVNTQHNAICAELEF